MRKYNKNHRIQRAASSSFTNVKYHSEQCRAMDNGVWIDMGWGRLIFGQTFASPEDLAMAIRAEAEDNRDIAFYIHDPHVVLRQAPNELFLDPSHSYRLWSSNYRHPANKLKGVKIRRLQSMEDAAAVNRLYARNGMVQCDLEFFKQNFSSKLYTYYVAETLDTHEIIGTITGIDHQKAFDDPENGSSLWCLAVDPQTNVPGVGENLVRHLAEHYFTRGRQFIDLSVMHDNSKAICLYEKLGFQRIAVFTIKRKNVINEKLYISPQPEEQLNPYAEIIINEARRRGISINILDPVYGYFKLQMGGRSIVCRESLSELTSAVAMSRCDDKRVTHRVLQTAGLNVPEQYTNQLPPQLEKNSWVVKPARGEQGMGISVDVSGERAVKSAIEIAQRECQDYLVEEYVQGDDLRIVVIGYEVVAAALRKPPQITGTGDHNVKALIEKYNRRRMAATGGESSVPLDSETERCIELAGYHWDDVLPLGKTICVRKTANLHTGGTIHDVTDELHPTLRTAAVSAAQALTIPVTGLDLIVQNPAEPDYVFIEANERPGLANHEPQPTAEKFIDFLFPQSLS